MSTHLKKILFSLLILVTPYMNSASNSMDDPKPEQSYAHAKPGPEAWKDEKGQRAPAKFRSTADALYDAVWRQDSSGWDAGWCKRTNPHGSAGDEENTCLRIFLCCLSCGCTECCATPIDHAHFDNFHWSDEVRTYSRSSPALADTVHKKDMENSTDTWKLYKEVLNSCVQEAEQYSGDISLDWKQVWVEHPEWTVASRGVSYTGGRRDLNFVVRDTMNFVNTHGGWISEEKK